MSRILFSKRQRVQVEKQTCPFCHGKKVQEIEERCVTMCREGRLYDHVSAGYKKPCPYWTRFQEFTVKYPDISAWPDEKVCNGSGQLFYVCWKCKGKGEI